MKKTKKFKQFTVELATDRTSVFGRKITSGPNRNAWGPHSKLDHVSYLVHSGTTGKYETVVGRAVWLAVVN